MNTTDKSKQRANSARITGPSSEGVLDRLFAWLDISLVRQAGGELARECHTAVWEATWEKARGMSRDELAGLYSRPSAGIPPQGSRSRPAGRRRVRESLRQRILAERPPTSSWN